MGENERKINENSIKYSFYVIVLNQKLSDIEMCIKLDYLVENISQIGEGYIK